MNDPAETPRADRRRAVLLATVLPIACVAALAFALGDTAEPPLFGRVTGSLRCALAHGFVPPARSLSAGRQLRGVAPCVVVDVRLRRRREPCQPLRSADDDAQTTPATHLQSVRRDDRNPTAHRAPVGFRCD